MIVRPATEGLHLISQPDHARLAGWILEHCLPLRERERRSSILRATANHDNGWSEPDASPSIDPASSRIADFIRAPVSVRQGVWPRTVDGMNGDPWAAALIAHHAVVAYDRLRGDGAWSRFFIEMEASRDALRLASELDLPLADLVADYAFVRLGDLISLAFCTGTGELFQHEGWTVQLHGTRVVVTPDVFAGEVIPIEISARLLSSETFATDGELRAAYAAAPVVTLRGEVSGTTRA